MLATLLHLLVRTHTHTHTDPAGTIISAMIIITIFICYSVRVHSYRPTTALGYYADASA